MTDTESYIKGLEVTNPLTEPIVRSAIQTLQIPFGSRGLDAGCGIGLQTRLLCFFPLLLVLWSSCLID